MTTINIRTDEKRKKLATAIFNEMGLDMSSAIQLFLQQVIITKSIPFPIRTVNGFTPEQEKAILDDMRELEADIADGKAKSYSSSEEMAKDLLKDGCTGLSRLSSSRKTLKGLLGQAISTCHFLMKSLTS
ncbi:MAG: type II toxin-antitoxin system RelB/DinJ family antitoxin [Candidatus Gracilibacteria bacterium]